MSPGQPIKLSDLDKSRMQHGGLLNKHICEKYVGHPISSDNGLISQKLILKSEFYYPLHVVMGVAYSCLKYEVFITT